MSKSEHYKNNPNDKELSDGEKKFMKKIELLRNKIKLLSANTQVSIGLRNTQLKSDTQIKEMFKELFPQEYRKALMASIEKYGATEKKEVRRLQLIKDMGIKDNYLIKHLVKKYDTTI